LFGLEDFGLCFCTSGARLTTNLELCSECQSEEIQPSAGKRRDETTAKGTGLAKSAGKEDPVELDS
ncbi:39800_t:CDS:2, partial [Gigaspora margarita]